MPPLVVLASLDASTFLELRIATTGFLSVGPFSSRRVVVSWYLQYPMGSLRGEAPHELQEGRVWKVWGDAVAPQKINCLMSVLVRFGTCLGSVSFALKIDMKSTLTAVP